MAAQVTPTNGPSARGLAWCRARARSPFPIPVSACVRMGGRRRVADGRWSSRPIISRTASMCGLSPCIWPSGLMVSRVMFVSFTRGHFRGVHPNRSQSNRPPAPHKQELLRGYASLFCKAVCEPFPSPARRKERESHTPSQSSSQRLCPSKGSAEWGAAERRATLLQFQRVAGEYLLRSYQSRQDLLVVGEPNDRLQR
jgi:hypothetical protein